MKTPPRKIAELNINPVDQNSPIPLYQQIRIDLQSMLQSGELAPNDLLPPEIDLADAYQVSRQTIRQAISKLVTDQLVERTPGRGTTVLSGKNQITFFLDQSFAKQIAEKGLTPHSEVLRKKKTIIDGSTPESLKQKKGSQALDLVRIRYGNESPIGVQYTTIITDLCPDLYMHDFKTQSLYYLLLHRYKLPIARIDQLINATIADTWHMNLLEMTGIAPLLMVRTTAYLENGEPIESSTSYYRADRYEFSVSQNY